MADEVTGGDEQVSTRSVEMEAPEYLEEGKNFFDYPPFAQAIALVSSHSVVEENDLQRAILWVGKKPELLDVSKQTSLVDFVRAGKEGKYPRVETAQSLRELLRLMSEFPDWADYVRLNCAPVHYGSDGKFIVRKNKFVAPQSYPAWLFQRIQRQQRLRDAKIAVHLADVFTQKLPGSPIVESLKQPASPNPQRRWRLVKPSGAPPLS